MDYTVHGILQARILEWVAFPFSRGSSQPRDQTQVSHIAGIFFTSWATREDPFIGWGRKKKNKTGHGSHVVTYTSKIEISFCRSWEDGKGFWMSRAESSRKAPALYTLEQQPLFPIQEACQGTLFQISMPIQMQSSSLKEITDDLGAWQAFQGGFEEALSQRVWRITGIQPVCCGWEFHWYSA